MWLGSGERETISVALELYADVVLMDDQPGRLAAESLGITISGTLAVLLQASGLGLIDFRAAVGELKILGFRMSAKLESAIMMAYETNI